jgi:hypothetical protein
VSGCARETVVGGGGSFGGAVGSTEQMTSTVERAGYAPACSGGAHGVGGGKIPPGRLIRNGNERRNALARGAVARG